MVIVFFCLAEKFVRKCKNKKNIVNPIIQNSRYLFILIDCQVILTLVGTYI